MKLIPIALVALSLLVGCSDPSGGGEMIAEEYANGQLKSRGYIKGKNIRTGGWTFWYEDGQKESEGRYVDHQREGLWTNWDENGQKSKGEYKDGKQEGLWTEWRENGKKWGEGEYKDGKIKGLWTYWRDNGHKWGTGNYKDGKREGL